MTPRWRSITGQAARRLVLSLGLFVVVVGLSSITIYRAAIDKAAAERANDLSDFYRTRLIQLERDWEVRARDFRVRLEYTRLLEEPHTAALNLQAFMTIQGSDRRFHYLLIQSRTGDVTFRFGKGLAPEQLPGALAEGTRYFSDDQSRLYRILEEPVWLGAQGMGRMQVFFRIDNTLLGQLASPGVTLNATYQGDVVASSLGPRGLERAADVADVHVQQRILPWNGEENDPVRITISAPVKTLFTTAEIAIAVSVIPVLDGLILWFTVGTWLMRQTRRINALEHAVRQSSGEGEGNEGMERKLREASDGQTDEIDAVAETIRRTTLNRELAERRIVTLNDDLKRHNAQLEAVNSELESFIYSVSHDLRAPLRAMAGYSTILMEDFGDNIGATGTDYLNRICTGAARMSQRMDDLLYLSRISRQELVCSHVDLSAIATFLVEELRKGEPERRVEVVIADGIVAFADPRLMSVALSNLIANAWKFTQRVPGPRIEFGITERDDGMHYWVRDNGAGFEPAFAERMFLPFHRLHSDAEFEGTGLGLAIVERVIRRHGGRVWAEGTVQGGATIYFTL